MNEILSYYETSDEAGRLQSGSGLLEKARTQEILLRVLPSPPARVLDVGGGPGEYAGWLAGLGYEVVLVDPVDRHLQQARRFPLHGFALGDARRLEFADASADAVLLLGPLYHLTESRDRQQALSEAMRVLRPGGVVAASAISRWASLLDSLTSGFVDDEKFWPVLERGMMEGQHRNDTGNALYFTSAYFHRPAELADELSEAGYRDVLVAGVEGPCWMAKNIDARWESAQKREQLLLFARRVQYEEAMQGCSLHLIATGRKRHDNEFRFIGSGKFMGRGRSAAGVSAAAVSARNLAEFERAVGI